MEYLISFLCMGFFFFERIRFQGRKDYGGMNCHGCEALHLFRKNRIFCCMSNSSLFMGLGLQISLLTCVSLLLQLVKWKRCRKLGYSVQLWGLGKRIWTQQ
ncbi:hypothetical protein M758_1G004800 [Ceratodon purpureus]|nr:hypothetical protein M758_1G004800 [Ceratodon purpureus]